MRRLLILVSAIVFVDTVFYAVVAPILPDYTDELGLSKAAAGILGAAYPAGTLLGAIPSGMLAARVGPRAAVVTGLTLLGLSSLAFGFAEHIVLLDLARFVQGVGGACSWAGGLAWLMAAAPAERRGEVIGTALGAAIGGALLGPAVGALAGAVGTEAVFASVLGIAAVLVTVALREPAPARAEATAGILPALRSRPVVLAMWLVALPAVSFGVLNVLVPLRLDDLGAGTAAVAAVFLVAAAAEGVASPFSGRMSDRRGRLVPIRVGMLGAAVLVVFVPLPDTAVATGLLVVATTAALGFFWAPAMAMLSDAAEAAGTHQGLAFALVNLAWASGATIGAGGGGALADATADTVPFALVAGLLAATLAVLSRRSAASYAQAACPTPPPTTASRSSSPV